MSKNENQNYCATCTNAKTPLCNLCITVHKPSGNNKLPTMYVGYDEILHSKIETKRDDLSVLIQTRAKRLQPIPVEWVMEYNKTISVIAEE